MKTSLLHSFSAVCAAAFLCSTPQAAAYMIILDMDVSTAPAPPPPGPLPGLPGPATGFESSLMVTSGTTVTVVAYLVNMSSTQVFDTVGIDINHTLPGDTATATIIPGTTLAGMLAGSVTAGAIDLFSIAATAPGAALTPGPLTPLAPYAGNIGGAGYFDSTLAPAPGGQFAGIGFTPGLAPLSYIDVLGFDITVTGAPGDLVTLDPTGVFLPGAYGSGFPPFGVPTSPGGEALYDSVSGSTSGVASPSGTFVGGTITIVPEPATTTLLGLGLLGFTLRRKPVTLSAS